MSEPAPKPEQQMAKMLYERDHVPFKWEECGEVSVIEDYVGMATVAYIPINAALESIIEELEGK